MTEARPSARRFAAVVYNPTKITRAKLSAAVVEEERRHGWTASEWFATTAEDPGLEAGRQALLLRPTLVIVAGGDGTVRAVVQAVQGSGVPVALVPSGTGNLLARNLGLPLSDLAGSVRAAFGGSERRIDAVTAELTRPDGSSERHTFAVMAGVGLDARMAAGTDDELKKRIGWLAYTDPIARSVMSGDRTSMRYRIDGGRSHTVAAHTVIVGNCGTLTGGILQLPGAVIDDGLLDVAVLIPRRRVDWARVGIRLVVHGLLHRTRAGRGVMAATPALRALRYLQATTIEVAFDVPQEVELDGDGLGPVIGVRWNVTPGALVVKIPADDAAGIGTVRSVGLTGFEPATP